ncbi:MAG: hypothetical protein NTZ73_01580 [Candidatus Diapherotrites archaeon]|nr:hypothetical protein [Candidatus Diapherotrites archaeon]
MVSLEANTLSKLLEALPGTGVYFEKCDAWLLEPKPSIYPYFGTSTTGLVENAPEFMLRDDKIIYFVVELQRILDLTELQRRDPWAVTDALNFGLDWLGKKRGFALKKYLPESFSVEDYYHACKKICGENLAVTIVSLLFDVRKRFNYYHTPAFFQREGECKLVNAVILAEKENWQELMDALTELIPQKQRAYYLKEKARLYDLGEYEGISFTIVEFYEIFDYIKFGFRKHIFESMVGMRPYLVPYL